MEDGSHRVDDLISVATRAGRLIRPRDDRFDMLAAIRAIIAHCEGCGVLGPLEEIPGEPGYLRTKGCMCPEESDPNA